MSTTDIWNNIIVYAVQVGLLVGVGASLPALLRLKSPGARLMYWQLLLVACFAMPWVRPWRSEVIAVTSMPIAEIQAAPQMLTDAAPKPFGPSFALIALWILAAGVAVRVAWLAAGFLKLALYRRHGRPIPSPPAWIGAAGDAQFLLSEELSGPVTFGFFRPVVLLPATFPSLSETTQDAILFYELLHVQRRDWLFTVAEEVVRAVFWFHPAIWWVLGKTQLAREQTVDRAVIEMTQAPDRYVDALLAMAGVTGQLDLAPAPLFLRRRHLKQRVKGIVQEVRMSKTRLILAQVAAVAAMFAACWIVSDAVPLRAQAQIVADTAGVTVNLNGLQLMHRTPVAYSAEALAKNVEGTVVVQVRLDATGQVVDDAILSGPEELRKGVQQSVLNWHFDKSAGSSTRVVNIDFVKPLNSPVAATGAPVPTRVQVVGTAPVSPGRGGATASAVQQTAPPIDQKTQQSLAAVLPRPTIDRIEIRGLSDSATAQLEALLPVHAGDAFSGETFMGVVKAALKFDEHLTVAQFRNDSGEFVIRVEPRDAQAAIANPLPPAPPGAMRIGANVMAANLVNQVKPMYPQLAKMARVQGIVKFEAIIGKDGTIEDLKLVSGPPLLVQTAMDAVKQWVYKPTLLNDAPVEVVTTIDVNFTLSDVPPPFAQ